MAVSANITKRRCYRTACRMRRDNVPKTLDIVLHVLNIVFLQAPFVFVVRYLCLCFFSGDQVSGNMVFHILGSMPYLIHRVLYNGECSAVRDYRKWFYATSVCKELNQ